MVHVELSFGLSNPDTAASGSGDKRGTACILLVVAALDVKANRARLLQYTRLALYQMKKKKEMTVKVPFATTPMKVKALLCPEDCVGLDCSQQLDLDFSACVPEQAVDTPSSVSLATTTLPSLSANEQAPESVDRLDPDVSSNFMVEMAQEDMDYTFFDTNENNQDQGQGQDHHVMQVLSIINTRQIMAYRNDNLVAL